ncbi:hypothetical protein OHT59_19640 [Streptomyces sp. NBC_00243]|uniref:hypothetical protein n=1 Tax=Streptomyces sp. NBC_00243 TaxID=2975688 RepID=UPI002DDAD284|nr:hypothetical protein [Streptomyces sp. NBC_00243]WRZ20555.1 hypothetical protein OHT59_19640 [Streptomyces sp. NBC_00243]
MKRRSLPVAAAFAATAALLLTACGSGDDGSKDSDKIAGADTGGTKTSTSPSPSAEADTLDRPTMTFPSDFTMVFDRTEPSEAKEAAVLNDAENFVRAINYGVVQQDAEDAAYKFYSDPRGTAQAYAKKQIQQYIDGGWTVTGTQRYTQGKVDMASGGERASVSFCDDDSKFYGKEVKSGKVLKTEPSDKDYYFFEIVMTTSKDAEGLWTAEAVQVQKEATQCKA